MLMTCFVVVQSHGAIISSHQRFAVIDRGEFFAAV